jgi:hypothetical protein
MYNIEHTDTFGGEANYSWVRRYRFAGSEKQAIRAAKSAVGWTGAKCYREYLGGYGYAFRRPGVCQVLFVTWADSGDDFYGAPIIGKDGHPVESAD